MKKLLALCLSASLSCVMVHADDTEIFTGLSSSGGGADTIFILDTSGSMAALEEQQGAQYNPEEEYPDENYGFDPDSHYIFRANALGDLGNLSSAEINRLKEYRIALDGYNCSRTNTLDNISELGYSTGKYIVFVPNIGWRGPDDKNGKYNQLWEGDRPKVPYNSSVIIQCKEAGSRDDYNYPYNGSTYRGPADDDEYEDINFPYTNDDSYFEQYRWDENDEDQGVYTEIYSGNYLNFKRYIELNNLGTQYKMRLDIVADAAKEVIAANDDPSQRFALMRFSFTNKGGYVDIPLQPVNQVSTLLSETLDSYDPAGSTPLTETLYEAHNYLTESTVDYGVAAESVELTGIYRGPKNDDLTWTDPDEQTFSVYPGGAFSLYGSEFSVTSAAGSTKDEAGTNYKMPDTGECGIPNQKIILFSDGKATKDTQSNEDIENLVNEVLKSEYYSGETPPPECDKKTNGGCLSALAWYMSNKERRDALGLPDLTIDTIGGFLGEGDDAEKALIEAAAYGLGTYYPVSNEDEVRIAVAKSLKETDDSPSSFTAPAIAVSSYNSLQISDELYYAVFKPNDTGAWAGNLKRYRISSKGVVDSKGKNAIGSNGYFVTDAVSFWSETEDGFDVEKGGVAERFGDVTRNIKLLNTAGNILQATPDAIMNLSGDLLGLEASGLVSSVFDTVNNVTYKPALANWISGLTPDGKNNRLGMEDAIHSRPVVINYTNDRRIVFIGTNSGYLHAFDTKNGQEVFSLIPQEVLTNALFYMDPNRSSAENKIYGLDGPITYWHNDKNLNGIVDGSDTVYLYVGMRRGGHSYYAFNITDPNNPSLLWQNHGSYLNDDKNIPNVSPGYERMGQTWSSLKPALVNWNGKDTVVLFAGGGYDPAEDDSSATRLDHTTGNTIYMIDATSGKVLWDAYSDAPNMAPDMKNSFPSDISPVDRDGDGFIDLLYAADTGGRLWRFDWNSNNTGFNGGVIADINDSATNGVSGNRRFYVRPDVAYIKTKRTSTTDEGNELIESDKFLLISIGSGYRAHPLDEEVDDHFYLLKDPHGLNYPATYTKLGVSDLAEWSSNDATDKVKSSNGWYFNPSILGEKIMSPSITLNGVVTFNTFATGSTDEIESCSGNLGVSRTYQFALSEEIRNRIKCSDGGDSCKPDIPGEKATGGDIVTRLKPDPTLVMPDPEETECPEGETCDPLTCDDYAVSILSGTTLTEGNMDRCDLFETNYWEEEL
jgi:type IV pilus assembly protein PilY1